MPPSSGGIGTVAAMSACVTSRSAAVIWLAKKRRHINSYKRRWGRERWRPIAFGVRRTEVGRIASCASWARLALLLCVGGSGGTKRSPYSFWT